MVVTNTDTGTPGASESTIPPTTETSANRVDSNVALAGEAVRWEAAAAGVISSESTSSAPTICTPIAAAMPTSTAKIIDTSRIGTPRAAATSGSTLANQTGR